MKISRFLRFREGRDLSTRAGPGGGFGREVGVRGALELRGRRWCIAGPTKDWWLPRGRMPCPSQPCGATHRQVLFVNGPTRLPCSARSLSEGVYPTPARTPSRCCLASANPIGIVGDGRPSAANAERRTTATLRRDAVERHVAWPSSRLPCPTVQMARDLPAKFSATADAWISQ